MTATKKICHIEGCGKTSYCRGWCRPHYNSWYTYGDPEYRKNNPEVCPPHCRCGKHNWGKPKEKIPSSPCLNCGEVRMVRNCYGEGMRFERKFCNRLCFNSYQQKQMVVRRASGVAYHYDMSADEYQARLAVQDGACAICTKKISGRDIHRDHCHATGEWRGLLCNNCNTGLGFFGDDVGVLLRAADYVMKGGVSLDHSEITA